MFDDLVAPPIPSKGDGNGKWLPARALEIGNVVVLNSGGPPMTISTIDAIEATVSARWFVGYEIFDDIFDFHELCVWTYEDAAQDKAKAKAH